MIETKFTLKSEEGINFQEGGVDFIIKNNSKKKKTIKIIIT